MHFSGASSPLTETTYTPFSDKGITVLEKPVLTVLPSMA
jgi:hypothetical protein